ncbi:MAG TPA: phosphotransferase family protein [Candidatus Binatia bacterium]|jgi:aminoglycoside phosphotransferase (APT) family kinase protein|nr:phosphotransferase family protein [Candidatus Binatia bacterium]
MSTETKPNPLTPEQLASSLVGFIKRASQPHQVQQVRIENLRLLTGGASRQTWSFDAILEHAEGQAITLPLVLRSDPQEGPQGLMDRSLEYRVIEAAYAEGVLAPKPYFLGDDSLGVPFFIMERIEGETIPRRLFREPSYSQARQVMTKQLGARLARIHRVPFEKYHLEELSAPQAGNSPAEEEINRYQEMYHTMAREPHPAFELAFRWLRQHLPVQQERVLVHGDYRMGNIIFGPEGVRAILDWELAHIGDPMEDLGWICVRSWRFGNDHLPVGGVGTREEFWRAYEEAGGYAVDPTRVHFWEIFGNLRWGVICLNMTQPFLDGQNPGVELAAIGRRTAETEWELLHLMEE